MANVPSPRSGNLREYMPVLCLPGAWVARDGKEIESALMIEQRELGTMDCLHLCALV